MRTHISSAWRPSTKANWQHSISKVFFSIYFFILIGYRGPSPILALADVIEFLENYAPPLEINNKFLAYMQDNKAKTDQTAMK